LPLALMDSAGHLAFQEQQFDPLLELANHHHALVQPQEKFTWIMPTQRVFSSVRDYLNLSQVFQLVDDLA
jgi:hypothetical protein